MKNKFSILIISLSCIMSVIAQNNMTTEQIDIDWYKASPETSVYGIDLQGAKDLLKNREIIKNPVVAIIGSGCDIEHEALKKSIWQNPNEIDNGIDDDNNGYIDDINGWNFIGGKIGETMPNTLTEVDREWLRLKDKYVDIFYDGENYFRYEDGKRKYFDIGNDLPEYTYFRSIVESEESSISGMAAGYYAVDLFKEYTLVLDSTLMNNFPDKTRDELSRDDVVQTAVDVKEDLLKAFAYTFILVYIDAVNQFSPATWQDAYDNFMFKQESVSLREYEKAMADANSNYRSLIVGDNPLDINDKEYGNNMLLTNYSNSSTLLSGIIAGSFSDENFEGIIPEAKIMPLVVNAPEGEPLVKDISLAIRYAVDNGADVILLPQQSSFYSSTSKIWMHDALSYAEKKEVLVVVPVWQASVDLSKKEYFPSATMFPESELHNLVTVGCSDSNGLPSVLTNYGEGLDMFAPGMSLYSTLPGDLYVTVNSAALGAAVTAGSAAFIKAYFPEIKGSELRTILLDNVTDMADEEVEISIMTDSGQINELFLYDQICKSGGIVNLKKSVESILKNK